MKYNYIYKALNICSYHVFSNEEECKKGFIKYVEESFDDSFISNLKFEILEARKDLEWNWKKAAEQEEFFSTAGDLSEYEILSDLRYIMWDYLFLDRIDVLPASEEE